MDASFTIAHQHINQADALLHLLCNEQAFTSLDTAMVENTLWLISDILRHLSEHLNTANIPTTPC